VARWHCQERTTQKGTARRVALCRGLEDLLCAICIAIMTAYPSLEAGRPAVTYPAPCVHLGLCQSSYARPSAVCKVGAANAYINHKLWGPFYFSPPSSTNILSFLILHPLHSFHHQISILFLNIGPRLTFRPDFDQSNTSRSRTPTGVGLVSPVSDPLPSPFLLLPLSFFTPFLGPRSRFTTQCRTTARLSGLCTLSIPPTITPLVPQGKTRLTPFPRPTKWKQQGTRLLPP
jgi:hypothetical protein